MATRGKDPLPLRDGKTAQELKEINQKLSRHTEYVRAFQCGQRGLIPHDRRELAPVELPDQFRHKQGDRPTQEPGFAVRADQSCVASPEGIV